MAVFQGITLLIIYRRIIFSFIPYTLSKERDQTGFFCDAADRTIVRVLIIIIKGN